MPLFSTPPLASVCGLQAYRYHWTTRQIFFEVSLSFYSVRHFVNHCLRIGNVNVVTSGGESKNNLVINYLKLFPAVKSVKGNKNINALFLLYCPQCKLSLKAKDLG